MKVLEFLIKIIRLPIDLLLLTFHYVKGTCWLAVITIKRGFGRKTRSWPYGCFSRQTPAGSSACLPGRKYGNLFLFRSLCPDAARGNESACETRCLEKLQMTRKHWRPPLGRIFGVGLFLAMMWATLGYGVYQLLPTTRKMKKVKAENFLAKGDKLANEMKYERARLAYENAIKQEPKNAYIFLQLGRCLLKLDRGSEGLVVLQRAVKLDPNLWEGHLELAKLLNRPGYYKTSQHHAEKVKEINAENREAYFILASTLVYQKMIGEAEKVLTELQQFSNLTSQEHYQIGELYSLTPDLRGAELSMKKALDLDPENVDARIGLAYVLAKQTQYDSATKEIDKVLSQHPENLKALIGHAEVFVGKTEIQKAINAYEKILQMHPNNPNVATRLAGLLIQTNVLDRGIELAQKVADYYPQHPGANSLLLKVYYKQKRYRLAIEYANRILSIPNANHDFARRLLGRSYVATKRYDLAVKTLEDVVKTAPNDFDSQISLAYAYHNKGEFEQAIARYQKAAKINPESKIPYDLLATLYTQQNQINDAITHYRNALEKSPEDRASANNLAMLLIERAAENDLDEAYQLIQGLVQNHSNNAVVMDTMGWVLFHRGDYKQAQEKFERAIQIDSYLPDPYYHLGKLFLKKNNPELAEVKLERALKLSTSFPGANDAKMLLTKIQRELD